MIPLTYECGLSMVTGGVGYMHRVSRAVSDITPPTHECDVFIVIDGR